MILRRAALMPAATVALGVLALPPGNVWALTFAFWLPVLWLAARVRTGHAFWIGLLTGAAFGAHLYFGAAVLDPTAMLAATAIVATCFGIFIACAARLLQQPTLLSPILLGGLWVALECVLEACAIPFTFAVMLAKAPAFLQAAALGGQQVVVFFAVAIQCALVAWSVQPGRAPRAYTTALLVGAFASLTLAGQSQQPAPVGTLSVAAMQTDIHPFYYVHAEADAHLSYLAEHRQKLKAALPKQAADLVVWPEVAFARFEWRRPNTAPIANVYASLVAGNDIGPDGQQFNAVFGVDAAGVIRSRHVKNKLLPRLEREYSATRDIAPHNALPGRPGSLICFESAFPATASKLAAGGAQLLTIATSDTYAGPSLLSAFHASFAVVRAVETRRAVVRAANAGPSMIVLPDGQIAASLAQFESGVLTGTVPLIDEQSVYTKTAGWWRGTFLFLGLISVVIALQSGAPVRRRPSWTGVIALLIIVSAAALYGQWRSASNIYLAARHNDARVGFGFLNELAGPADYEQLRSEVEQQDLPAVVAAALRRFGLDVARADVARREEALRATTINKVDARMLFDAYGFATTTMDDEATHSVLPCAVTLADGSSVLITRQAPDALQIFAPAEAGYSTVPRSWLKAASASQPVCVAGRAFGWDLP